MTGRHTLYGQSLVRSANSMANLSRAVLNKHWVKSWVKPPKKQEHNNFSSSYPAPSGISSGENTTSNSTPQPSAIPVYEFEVHSWVLTEELEESKDESADKDSKDLLDLSKYHYEPRKEGSTAVPVATKGESLTEADIRGAVGGGDMIGFSSSQAQTMKSVSDKADDIKNEGSSNETPETENVSTVKDEKSEEEKDTEGDIKME